MLFDEVAGLGLESEIAGEAGAGPAGFRGGECRRVAAAEAGVDRGVGPGFSAGRLAVVAVLLERGADDKPQPLLQTVWANLPLERGETVQAQAQIDLNQLLPQNRGYYTYMGSLTTPPCSEGVLWMVLRQPVPLTAQQVGVFSRLYPMNARPLQAGSGRLIKESQ